MMVASMCDVYMRATMSSISMTLFKYMHMFLMIPDPFTYLVLKKVVRALIINRNVNFVCRTWRKKYLRGSVP